MGREVGVFFFSLQQAEWFIFSFFFFTGKRGGEEERGWVREKYSSGGPQGNSQGIREKRKKGKEKEINENEWHYYTQIL